MSRLAKDRLSLLVWSDDRTRGTLGSLDDPEQMPARTTSISIFDRRRKNLERLLETKFRSSQAALARAINRSPSYVWRLLTTDGANAKRLGEDLARLIERACDLPEYWLDQDHDDSAQSVLGGVAITEVAKPAPRPSGPRSIPIYELDSLDTRMSGHVRGVVVGLVYTDTELSIETFALIVSGTAMEPDLRPGDKVFIDPTVAPQPGDVVLAVCGGEARSAVLRQYRPANDSPGATFELYATNPAFASVWSDRTPCQIVGVMVEHHRYRRPA